MPLHACSKCQTVENTALGGYWEQQLDARKSGKAARAAVLRLRPKDRQVA
jgi:hypothetical protein